MEKMKRVLALLLVFAMLMPNLSTIALAADTEDPSVISTEPAVTAEETEASAEETETPPQVTEPSEGSCHWDFCLFCTSESQAKSHTDCKNWI